MLLVFILTWFSFLVAPFYLILFFSFWALLAARS
jgi:hypothetical protein